MPELLVELPLGVAHLWSAYMQLHQHKHQPALGLGDLVHWQALTGVKLTPWEVDTLLRVDEAAQAAVRERQNESRNPSH